MTIDFTFWGGVVVLGVALMSAIAYAAPKILSIRISNEWLELQYDNTVNKIKDRLKDESGGYPGSYV